MTKVVAGSNPVSLTTPTSKRSGENLKNNNMKIFYYKGYKIELFDYDYSRNKNSKWMASNENDCDEPMKISETFDEMLDKIDGLI